MKSNIGYQKKKYKSSCVTTLWNNALLFRWHKKLNLNECLLFWCLRKTLQRSIKIGGVETSWISG